jgi:hypothetical protein
MTEMTFVTFAGRGACAGRSLSRKGDATSPLNALRSNGRACGIIPSSAFWTASPHTTTTMTGNIQRFIARGQASGAAERANYQHFLSEPCDVLNAPRSDPTTPDEPGNAYVFEKSVPLPHRATGRIDLYRRGGVWWKGNHPRFTPQRGMSLIGIWRGTP